MRHACHSPADTHRNAVLCMVLLASEGCKAWTLLRSVAQSRRQWHAPSALGAAGFLAALGFLAAAAFLGVFGLTVLGLVTCSTRATASVPGGCHSQHSWHSALLPPRCQHAAPLAAADVAPRLEMPRRARRDGKPSICMLHSLCVAPSIAVQALQAVWGNFPEGLLVLGNLKLCARSAAVTLPST